jgi:alpha-2-macroglobulin
MRGFFVSKLCQYVIGTLALGAAHAADIKKFSPEGEVGGVSEVRVQFSQAMVAAGDRKAAAPFSADCPVPAQSYWDDEFTWVHAFEKSLPAGLKCQFTARSKLQTLKGEAVRTKSVYTFSTGGPRIIGSEPSADSIIEEHAAFILSLSAPVELNSVQANAYCSLEGVAEKVPLKILDGKDRQAILESAWGKKPREAVELSRYEDRERNTLVVQCAQAASPKSRLAIVWGAGILSTNGIRQTLTRRVEFKVQEAFTASMTCERENAQAPCTPIRPITVQFSSPISSKLAEQIRLKTSDGTRQPRLSSEAKKDGVADEVKFMPPFPEKSELTIDLPRDLRDGLERTLSNASLFPLTIRTAMAPPLAKFASAEFGLVERKADPVVPITLRRIEMPKVVAKSASDSGGLAQVRRLNVSNDEEILSWFGRLRRSGNEEGSQGAPERKDSRAQSLLANLSQAETIKLPSPKGEAKDGEYPFEVVGLPMPKPGFFVLELESRKLGEALLADAAGAKVSASTKASMYVKTSVLVTNLALHFRQGAENSLIWVTTLDKASPVKDAALRITDCNGKKIWDGISDAQGQGRVDLRLADALEKSGACNDENAPRFLVSARAKGADGVSDLGLVLSDWNRGIETWRFNLPSPDASTQGQRHQAVLDRSLLRAGETVSFKLFSREEVAKGLRFLPKEKLVKSLNVTHLGSGESFTVPIAWKDARYAKGQWLIPKQAKLGSYELRLPESDSAAVATFRVSEFKLPTMTGRIQAKADASLIAPTKLPLALQLDFLSSGPASNHAMTVSALMSDYSPSFDGYEEFRFREVPSGGQGGRTGAQESDESDSGNARRLVADKLTAKLDAKGSGAVVLEKIPNLKGPAELQLEASYADANGEIQTLSNRIKLWPSGVVVGLKTENWVSVEKALNTQMLVLNNQGKPVANHMVEIFARVRDTLSTRKRLVGGFYSYDNSTEYRDLGRLCSANTNAAGLASCKLDIKTSGNIELIAQAKDSEGRLSQSYSDIWVTDRGELWFDGEDHDRVDLIPEKRRYQPGEIAKFQVRMPFRLATALVAIEREGVIDSFTVQLTGKDPTLEVPIKEGYGPNVFVSALIVRERLREVPWYSFFQWGWRAPSAWWQAFRENLAPTATVDLAKPAHKLGIAEIQVGLSGQALKVQVKSDQPSYQVRGLAKVKVAVTDAQGKPLSAGTSVAFAAVDQALLELANNDTWALLESMWVRRGYSMETFTAQMHVVGKRHYGRKAAPPGGGGGIGPTREIFDTLLVWNAEVVLNDKGEADLEVPLNDSLTRFKLVAIADHGENQFGTGSASIETRQDLQLISGLPSLARADDNYRASVTLRNTTAREMKVQVDAVLANSKLKFETQTATIPAQGAQEIFWTISNAEVLKNLGAELVPKNMMFAGLPLSWTFTAKEIASANSAGVGAAVASDRVKIAQTLNPTVKPEVQMSSLSQLGIDGGNMAFTLPPGALPGSGLAQVSLSRSLLGSQSGLKQFFANYPFACLEQRTSKAIGLRDGALWKTLVSQLPLYLDSDGLAMYFPATTGEAKGYDILTSYVLSTSHEAAWDIPDAELARMHRGLVAFVEGKITREFWAPQKDLAVRKLAAIEALSRRNAARPSMLDTITEDLVAWPTQALIDYYQILKRIPEIKDREAKLKNADNALRGRLSLAGNRMGFSNEQGDYWWWLMGSADLNANRLILATMDEAAWTGEISKLVVGSLARQQRGTWMTTTANVWGSLMLEKFAKDFERTPVSGQTKVTVQGQRPVVHPWGEMSSVTATVPFGVGLSAELTATSPTASAGGLTMQHVGEGKPWAQVSVLAAVPRLEPIAAGYRIVKSFTLLDGPKGDGKDEASKPGVKLLNFKRGDLVRVKLVVTASAPMTWVVLDDPVPAGAVVQDRGLGRDSAIATQGQQSTGNAYASYQEIGFSGVKSYFHYVPKGDFSIEYTLRLNTRGEFVLPATRAEAMYAPEVFGETPSPKLLVQ